MSRREFLNKTVMPVGTVLFLAFLFRPLCMVQGELDWRLLMELLEQLVDSHAQVEFNGGMDVRLLDEEILSALEKIKVKDYHFAWDDPRENLEEQFRLFRDAGLTAAGQCKVYVLTNYWSTMKEDLFRIYTLRNLGFMPFVMIYDKQKFVDSKGRWLPDVDLRYSEKQLRDFKICQHMQRWCGRINIIKSCPDFEKYEPYRRWMEKGCPVPRKILVDGR